jgi:hypothetical protein
VELRRLQIGQSSTKRKSSNQLQTGWNTPELINFMADKIEAWVGRVCFVITLWGKLHISVFHKYSYEIFMFFLKYWVDITDNNVKLMTLPALKVSDRTDNKSRHFFMVARFSVLYSGTALYIYHLYMTYLQATSTWRSEHVTWLIQGRADLIITNCVIASHIYEVSEILLPRQNNLWFLNNFQVISVSSNTFPFLAAANT